MLPSSTSRTWYFSVQAPFEVDTFIAATKKFLTHQTFFQLSFYGAS